MSRIAVVVLALSVSIASGCGTPVRYMTVAVPRQRIVAPADRAMVVFIRPSRIDFRASSEIIDETGRFMGQIPAHGHFAVSMSPGQHTFVVWALNTDAISANLAPGKIYFVEVNAVKEYSYYSAFMYLKAIKPTMVQWDLLDQWLRETTQYTTAQGDGLAQLATRKGADRVQERLRRGYEQLAHYQGADLDQHTLLPDDGIRYRTN